MGLIKCSDFQRLLLARSISDPSVLTTRGAYVFIFSLCCMLFVITFLQHKKRKQSFHLPIFVINVKTGSNCIIITCQEFTGLILLQTNKSLIFSVNNIRLSATDIIHKLSSVTINVNTNVTLQNNTLQLIEPFTFHVKESHIYSHSLE